MGTPKEHVEEIRRNKFSIGGKPNPLIEDLHQAVKNLSVELYAKDVHFLMELIQNAEDNQYSEQVNPSLEFVITSKDITATGAPSTLLIFNNEKGFSPKNIDSICSVGRSTKKGNRSNGYIGEKGIGFKSVFLITTQPYIFSNGYQIRFDENPCPHCGLGYIVPEWVEKPTLQDIKLIYGAGNTPLPSTIIVIPLKADKVDPVKQQLSNVHPEVLLFLTKIRHLSVREHKEDPKLNTVTAVSISSEINFVTRKNMNAVSYTLHLSAEENAGSENECSYYMWKQKFPVRSENVVDRRKDVEEWVITLAFPNQERLNRGLCSPGVYAFLPTEMVTNFPFIIQADFVLASSRETILMDDKWNQGILECVPSAFVDAFRTLIIGSDQAPISSLVPMFKFIPINSSPYEKLNDVREKIKSKMLDESIVPIETYKEQKHFCKPGEVRRLLPTFWSILTDAREQKVYLLDLSSHDGQKILSSSFDRSEYDGILNFFGVQQVKVDWYAKCIQSSNLADGVSEDAYLKLLLFVATNWGLRFRGTSMVYVPLLKYVSSDRSLSYFSVYDCTIGANRLVRADPNQSCPSSWLIDWNKEFGCASNRFFMPASTQKAVLSFPHRQTLLDWLENGVNFTSLSVYSFANLLCSSVKDNSKLAITYAHFLYHSFSKGYLSDREVDALASSMPLVDNYGCVTQRREGVLVPSNVSRWAELLVSNPWRSESFIELGKEYLRPACYADQSTDYKELMKFMKDHVGASDIPDISPPNAGFPAVNTPLTKENAFLLLDWIRNLKYRGVHHLPRRFLDCIKEGSWLRVTVTGWRPPSKSFLLGSSLGRMLQSHSAIVDIPLIDEGFYGSKINNYTEELKTIGVKFSSEEATEFIGEELMDRARSFTLSRNQVILMLKFIRYMRESLLPIYKFVGSVKNGRWLKTSRGVRSPVGSVLYDSEWAVASQISSIPFIDQAYFGEEISDFKEELKLLGVIVGFSGNYEVVVEHLRSTSDLTCLTSQSIELLLDCVKCCSSSSKLIDLLKGLSFLKTNFGFKIPSECFLYDPVWGCILNVFSVLPVIDHEFHGDKISTYKAELKKVGVVVDFEEAIKKFAFLFKQMVSQSSFCREHVKLFLCCFQKLKGTEYKFPADILLTIRDEKWLKTKVGGYRCPKECLLDAPEWNSISYITCLPFIDDNDNCYGKGIHEYKDELKRVGVVTELKDGVKFVPKCLNFPSDPSVITTESVFSLLECIRLLIQDHKLPVDDDDFKKRMSRNWLKTHAGYRSPNNCLLYDSKWSSYLMPADGPFIDENFYGSKIASYKKELNAIGVTVDVEKGCILVASHLESLSDLKTIVQIYRYLKDHNWKPYDKTFKKIWIPNGRKWVNPEECVLHDQDNLFGSKFYALEDIYDKEILPFFSFAMEVRNRPSLDDYVNLWNEWESSVEQLSHDQCCKFWMFMFRHAVEKKLSDNLMKLPASSQKNEIFLVARDHVFIPDNLHLKKVFELENVFVWCPSNLAPLSRCKLFDIYRRIGARDISESVCMKESSLMNSVEFKPVGPSKICNVKELIRLILGFLASCSLKMEPEKRHEAVEGLLRLSFFETVEPVTVSYSLSLSSGNIITKEVNRMVRWDRKSSKFFIQKVNYDIGEGLIKFASYFSEAISEGVLCEHHDHVPALSELITMAFLLKFNKEAIDFLMESKNLQIFRVDEEFLSSSF